MQLFSFLAIGSFAFGTLAARHVVHEKRSHIPHGWRRGERLQSHELLPMRIALTQSNMDSLDDYLMEVSHPESKSFGQHWTPKQIAETFAPSKETVNSVLGWLHSAGIDAQRISHSQSLGWINFDASVAEAEDLLKTKYHRYTHASGSVQLACEEYHVPEHVKDHVDFITPTLHFDAKLSPPGETRTIQARDVKSNIGGSLGRPGSGSLPKLGGILNNLNNLIGELENCNTYIVPDCLRALYLIPPVLTNLQKNPYGIVEYSPQAFLQGDLDLFFANYSKAQRQKTPNIISIDGGYAQTQNKSFGYNGESDLDLEYGMTLVNPISVTLYQVGDP
jgi:tripeptidyl-peptidase I